ncbi:pentatricopeptide repeat-containing protein At4g21880, mitochondrial-like isoform X2 [Rhododendron vialii]|nr:pentatricopeptide repeat-containing protein At4g21880, mitochondrial-like isoform X2 [Rhododendron vialii]XP_058219973.1 pentatricopeptide repeat-containing protein At4g21880, mitochondrial-like isoform X2 [Rhododendron vialii]
MCGQKLGTDATIQVFGKLGRETGVKEFNALIGLCIVKARETRSEDVWLQEISKVYKLLMLMRERGFKLEEESYGPFLMLLIDMEMVEEFQFFCGAIRDGNSNSLSRFAYYEMLLWIRVNNEVKIQELCDFIATNDEGDKTNFKEHYLLALCESDRKKEVLLLLGIVDITKFSSLDNLTNIFGSLGRLSLESCAEKFIRALKGSDTGAENISNFIYSYATSVPNLAVDDVISKFKHLHLELEVVPSSAAYEKLIGHCCNSLKAHVALDIVDQMFEAGLTLSIETFHSILCACEESCDYNLVHRIYSMICHNNLKPNNETFRAMINLRVKMKDFEGAYNMIKDLENMNLMPTAGMYNAIMAGYFREKNMHAGLRVLKQMEDADVKRDSQTFTYLIGNCVHEEDIVKYYEELKCSGVQITKHIFMALINAYAACGQFEKAKKVVLDKGVPVKSLSEIKSVLASALASHGQISEALDVCEEIKEAECNLEPKAIICLMDHLQTEGQLSRLIQLLEELKDSDLWIDGCCKVILYCVQFKHLSSAVDLLKQLVDKFCDDEVATEVIFDEVFSKIAESERADMQFGLNLLQAIKEQLDVRPSRKSLDFLLGACASAKDLQSSNLIWKEYQIAGLPYNVLSYLRMYQALLASGAHASATKILNKMPKDDPHVQCVIKACKATYIEPASGMGNKKKKTKKKKKKEMARE